MSKRRPEGCVRRRGAAFEAILSIRLEDGSRKRPRKTFKTEPEARKWLRQQLVALEGDSYVDPSKQTFGAFLAEWLDATRSTVKPTTFASYKTMVERHVIPRVGARKLQGGLTVPVLKKLYADLLEIGLSPTSVRYTHVIVRKALGDAVRWGRLVKNPTADVKPPRVFRREMRTLTAEQVATFLDHVADDDLAAAWYLAATSGMRRGELLGLQWGDVDWTGRRLQVQRSLVSINYTRIEFSDLKTSRGRAIDIDGDTLAVLKKHRAQQVESKLALGSEYRDQDLVFARWNGEPIHPDRLSKMFDAHLRDAGLPDVRLHDLRHTWATLALQAGVHPKVVQERLGHSSIAVTMDVYSHAMPTMQEQAAEKVATLIFGTVG